MPNPTRDQIISAHEALETLCARVPEDTPAYALKSLILAALPPRPQPTMAEIEWDDDKHYLAEATHPANGTVLMLGQDIDYMIKFLELNRAVSKTFWGNPEDLTLTGKRYTLTEVETHAG